MIHDRPQEAGGVAVARVASGVNWYPCNRAICRNMRTRSSVGAGFRGACENGVAAIVASGCAQMISYYCIGSQSGVTYGHEETADSENTIGVA